MQSEPATILWGLILAIHLLGMAIWVGGSAITLLVLRPSLNLLDQTQRSSVLMQSLKRFFRLLQSVVPTVLVTGWAMEIFREGGFAHADWHINAMQGLGLVMTLLFAWTYFGPFRKVQRAIRPKPEMFEKIRSLLTLTLVLGIVVVVVASLQHTY